MKKIATRQGFGEEIVALGKEDNGIYVVDVDIGKSCKTTDFAKQLPNQHVNVGIAEQNAAATQETAASAEELSATISEIKEATRRLYGVSDELTGELNMFQIY